MTVTDLAKLLYDAGPISVTQWSSRNPPTDVVGPPQVYCLRIGNRHHIHVDHWLLELIPDRETRIKFLVSEIAAHVEALLMENQDQ